MCLTPRSRCWSQPLASQAGSAPVQRTRTRYRSSLIRAGGEGPPAARTVLPRRTSPTSWSRTDPSASVTRRTPCSTMTTWARARHGPRRVHRAQPHRRRGRLLRASLWSCPSLRRTLPLIPAAADGGRRREQRSWFSTSFDQEVSHVDDWLETKCPVDLVGRRIGLIGVEADPRAFSQEAA